MDANNTKKLIAAAVIKKDSKILIAQRGKMDSLYGLWEFPGGKQEGSESLQECLKRELFEELSIVAEVGQLLCTSSFWHKENLYDMCVFEVPSFQGEIKLNEHLAIKWVNPEELDKYQYPAPDLPVIDLLKKQAI